MADQRRSPAGQEPDPAKIAAQHEDMARALGQVLGLHPQFGNAVARQGIGAIVDRAEMTDETGALGQALLMVGELGAFLQQRVAGGRGAPPGVIMQAARFIARQHEMDDDIGLFLLGAVTEMFQQAAARLSEGYEQAPDNAAGRPGE